MPPATVLRWRSASSFVPADQLAEEMGPWDHRCCCCCDFAWSWLDIRFDIYSILIWVVWPLLLDSILCYFGFSPKREDCEEERQHKMCRERRRDKQKSAPFRRAIHYCSCVVFAATEVLRSNAWLEASFGGSDPPSLKSSPISRCREPAMRNFLVELAGATARAAR